ncbi:F-box domain-containing protein [Orpheovirus IHUMI-LCC2]|uniref:F-box domain-containing protein n=1 Tax=Orpheovirus IHUMI-LCC2 TaxID=2023057 RepID=A0A2I2L454_9VIRU|nr:F-box domain-containing protein [Orpheovirus IHUMI-LCC2]SNW62308.1 F-box domain-containing protein [Orpheovirus IHUMI-LCC2]
MYNSLEILPNECIYNIIYKLHPYYTISLSQTCKRLHPIVNDTHYKNYITNVYMNNKKLQDLSYHNLMLLILYINPIKESIRFYDKNIKDLFYRALDSKSPTEDLISIIDNYQEKLLYEGKINSFITSACHIVGKTRSLNYNITKNIIKYNRNDISNHYWNINCEEKIIQMLKSGTSICEYMGYLERGGRLQPLLPYIANQDKDVGKYVMETFDIKSLYYYNPEILDIPCLDEMKMGYEWGMNKDTRLEDVNKIKSLSLALAGYLLGSLNNKSIERKDKLWNINMLSGRKDDPDVINMRMGFHVKINWVSIQKDRRGSKIYSILDEDEILEYRNKYIESWDNLGISSSYSHDIFGFNMTYENYDKLCKVMYKENKDKNKIEKELKHSRINEDGCYGGRKNRMDIKLIIVKNITEVNLNCIIDSIKYLTN